MRDLASARQDVRLIAVSHSDKEATGTWLKSLDFPGSGNVEVIVDDERESYAAWGLGVSSFWHVLNPWSLYSVYALGKKEGVWNRPTESGNRWQTSGSFAVDKEGVVQWARPSRTADDVPDFGEAAKALETVRARL